MSQPVWKLIGQLGDVNPLDYGGYFIYEDTTGVYDPEGELLIAPEDEDGEYKIYRFSLDRCTHINGILSDNEFHPDKSAWWAGSEAEKQARPQDTTYLSTICSTMDVTEEDLIRMFCSENPLERAHAYRLVGECHGFDNLDSYPLTMSRDEVEKRYHEGEGRGVPSLS